MAGCGRFQALITAAVDSKQSLTIVYPSVLVGARGGNAGPFIDGFELEAYNRQRCV